MAYGQQTLDTLSVDQAATYQGINGNIMLSMVRGAEENQGASRYLLDQYKPTKKRADGSVYSVMADTTVPSWHGFDANKVCTPGLIQKTTPGEYYFGDRFINKGKSAKNPPAPPYPRADPTNLTPPMWCNGGW